MADTRGVGPVVCPPTFPEETPVPPRGPTGAKAPATPEEAWAEATEIPLFPPDAPATVGAPGIYEMGNAYTKVRVRRRATVAATGATLWAESCILLLPTTAIIVVVYVLSFLFYFSYQGVVPILCG